MAQRCGTGSNRSSRGHGGGRRHASRQVFKAGSTECTQSSAAQPLAAAKRSVRRRPAKLPCSGGVPCLASSPPCGMRQGKQDSTQRGRWPQPTCLRVVGRHRSLAGYRALPRCGRAARDNASKTPRRWTPMHADGSGVPRQRRLSGPVLAVAPGTPWRPPNHPRASASICF